MWFRLIEVVNDLVDLNEVGVVEDEVVSEGGEGCLGDSGDGFGAHEVGSKEVSEISLSRFSGMVEMDSEDM